MVVLGGMYGCSINKLLITDMLLLDCREVVRGLVHLEEFLYGGICIQYVFYHSMYMFREFRRSSPPLGALSQFHAWWHVFAGMGTYLHIVIRYITMYNVS